jgi:hypothetical protein
MSSALEELRQRITGLPPAQKATAIAETLEATKHMRFMPLPGPQMQAYLSKADILLYGGEAGGGKTGLSVGLAQEHESSIIFRREASQTDGLEKFGKEVYGSDGFNGSDLEWSWGARSLKLAGLKDPESWQKHAGRPRDLMAFDEAGEFLVQQVASLLAWNRGPPGQRCRVVLASNPPRTSEGVWMLEWFAPWLDPKWPNRAKPGELRWAFMDPDRMRPEWVEAGTTRIDPDTGDVDLPLSFTFIPAGLKDNPYTDTPEYRAKLNALPEPLRSQLKKGIFAAGTEDHNWQIIPTDWVKAAQDRWHPKPPEGIPQTALGVDVGMGGRDPTVTAPRYDGWYDRLEEKKGFETDSGEKVAGITIARRKNASTIILDVGGGWGAEAYGVLCRHNGFSKDECVAYMGIKPSTARTKEGLLRFTNLRTQLLWQFREALDPSQHGGSSIFLPPDNDLLVDLTAPRFTISNRGSEGQFIAAESKEDVCARLGRSTNKGDAVVQAWFAGAKALARAVPASEEQGSNRQRRAPGMQVSYGPRRPQGMGRR